MIPQTGIGMTEEAIVIGEPLLIPLQTQKKIKKIFFVLWVWVQVSSVAGYPETAARTEAPIRTTIRITSTDHAWRSNEIILLFLFASLIFLPLLKTRTAHREPLIKEGCCTKDAT